MYSLILDEAGPSAPRHEVRAKIDELLAEPFDPDEADEYKRERWGLSPEAIAAAEAEAAHPEWDVGPPVGQ